MKFQKGDIVVVRKMGAHKYYKAGYVQAMDVYMHKAFKVSSVCAFRTFFKLQNEPRSYNWSDDMVYPTIKMV